VKRNRELDGTPNRPPADDQADADMAAAQDAAPGFRRATGTSRTRSGADSGRSQRSPASPFRVQPSMLNRNPPSYPAWEKPLTPYNFPLIRGQEKRQTMKPLIFVSICVVLILGAVLAFPGLMRNGNSGPAVSSSPSPEASLASQPLQKATPSPSATSGPPTPFASFQQYKVVAGDSVAKICLKFKLQQWELLQANPQLAGPAYAVRLNSYLNIPQPGQLVYATPGPTDAPTDAASPTVAAP